MTMSSEYLLLVPLILMQNFGSYNDVNRRQNLVPTEFIQHSKSILQSEDLLMVPFGFVQHFSPYNDVTREQTVKPIRMYTFVSNHI